VLFLENWKRTAGICISRSVVYRYPVSVDVVGAVNVFQRQQLHSRAVVWQDVSEAILGAITLQFSVLPRLIATNKLQILSATITGKSGCLVDEGLSAAVLCFYKTSNLLHGRAVPSNIPKIG